ncbi:MAG: CRISPR-associated helicase Cas3' [Caldilineaceae bacterium]|nr:CRISPR-associated helicase Cas3' [Caldilineaceae bacterium]
MPLYPFQQKVYDLVSAGQSVILQAPTGAGKTRAALYPFFRAWEEDRDFPRKCIYSVPLRVLANQFWKEYEDRTRNFGFLRSPDVTIQTGDQSDDPKLEGDLIFTTIDQTLSNFLNIPYSLSLNQGNINAGAVVSSYLVFDELHLYDLETTLPTTLHLLRLLRNVVPFLVMTATFSTDRVTALAQWLNAEPLVLSADEAAAIPSQEKTRRVHTVDAVLTADAVLQSHDQRTIVICNTVGRAQALYEALCSKAAKEVEVRLLHSRFLQSDRKGHEEWLQREFGSNKTEYEVESAILVATQVIEVGVDITSQKLHTELAPAASVIQRAGRCARYQHEDGDVYVYQLPVGDNDRVQYAPYQEQQDICDRTWAAFQTQSSQVFDFGRELDIVNEAHGPSDTLALSQLRSSRHYLAQRVGETIAAQERGAASELIRRVDSRTVIVHPEPKSIENPWVYEGFGIFRGSLFGAYEDLDALAIDQKNEWVMMTADALPEDSDSNRSRTVYRWRHLTSKDDMVGTLLLAINPALVSYSSATGFQLGVPGAPTWQSPLRSKNRQRQSFPPYRRETLVEHVRRMTQVYEHSFYDRHHQKQRRSLVDEISYAAEHLERELNWQPGELDNAIRLVIAVHDLGKLDVKWQSWAHLWQEKVSALRGEDLTIPVDYLAGHTDYDDQVEGEREANRQMRYLRPNHAAESAYAAMEWIRNNLNLSLTRAALTAIVRHHTAGAGGQNKEYSAHPCAQKEFKHILSEVGLTEVTDENIDWSFPAGQKLVNRLISPQQRDDLLAYFLIVRALRLADQRSQYCT